MKDEKWITVREAMPALGRNVEIKFENGNEQLAFLSYSESRENFNFSNNGYEVYDGVRVTHWRYPVEKKPDFEKLKKGDSIIAETISGISRIGFIERITSNGSIVTNSDAIGNSYVSVFECDDVKKITRINLEKQTFEEI